MNCIITKVILNPGQRAEKIKKELEIDDYSLDTIKQLIARYNFKPLEELARDLAQTSGFERENYCYCGLPLTKVSKDLKPFIIKEHILIREGIKAAGLNIYDPAEAPFNPQYGLVGDDTDVSDVDALMVLTSRFFELTNVAPTTGGGIEERTCTTYIKIPLIFVKEGGFGNGSGKEFPSRLSTGIKRLIVMEYSDAEKDKHDITQAVEMLKVYRDIGVGNCSVHGNMIIGFENGKSVCLRGLVESTFPKFKYDFTKYLKK